MSRKSMAIISSLLAVSMILSGCGLLGEGSKEIDPPQEEQIVDDASALDEESSTTVQGEEVSTNTTELYLIDKNNLLSKTRLSAQSFFLDKNQTVLIKK